MTPVVRDPICKTSTQTSVINLHEAPTRQSRSCRLRDGWQLSGSESFETCTQSSNISEVGLPLLCSTFNYDKETRWHIEKNNVVMGDRKCRWPRRRSCFFPPNFEQHLCNIVEFVEHGLTAFLRSRPFRGASAAQQAHV